MALYSAQDSAIWRWIWPNSLILLPKASRSEAYRFIIERHLLEIPTAMAARAILSISRFRIMWIIDSPGSPTTFSAGTLTSSKTNSAVFEALMPSLSTIFWPTE